MITILIDRRRSQLPTSHDRSLPFTLQIRNGRSRSESIEAELTCRRKLLSTSLSREQLAARRARCKFFALRVDLVFTSRDVTVTLKICFQYFWRRSEDGRK